MQAILDLVGLGQATTAVILTCVVLLIMSIWLVAVGIERFMAYRAGTKESYDFVMQLREFMSQRNMEGAITAAEKNKKSPIAKVMNAGLSEYVGGIKALKTTGTMEVGNFDIVDAVNRALERVKERETANLRKGLGGLATIASTAPFVGLFGTVAGILHTFQLLGSKGGGMDVVGPAIGEALKVTGFGLVVAIPSAMLFNYFTGRVEGFSVDMNDVSSEFVDFVLKEGRTS